MNRNLITLAGLFVAVACFSLGSNDAEARCGRRTRCCQNNGYRQAGNYGYRNNRNCGTGCGQATNCCQQPQMMATGCGTTQMTGYAPQTGYANQPVVNTVDAAPAPMNDAPAPKPGI